MVVRKVAGRPVVEIALSKCFVDPQVQRGEKANHLNNIGKKFNPKAVRNIVVSLRPDGRYSILDGQHRWVLLTQKGYTHVYAEVHEGLKIHEEATLFEELNQQKPVTKMDAFRVAMIQVSREGDASVQQRIFNEVQNAGFMLKISPDTKHSNLINAINPFMKAFNIGGYAHVNNVLAVLRWGFTDSDLLQEHARHSRFLEGLSLAIHEQTKHGVHAEVIAKGLRKATAWEIRENALELAKGNGFKEIVAIKNEVVRLTKSPMKAAA